MPKVKGIKFSDLVGKKLQSEEERSLWIPLAQEFDRPGGGPESAIQYLDAERQRLEERVKNLLEQARVQLGR